AGAGSSLVLERSTVANNHQGLEVDQGGSAQLRDNVISGNGTLADPAISVTAGQLTMSGNTLSDNGLGVVAASGAVVQLIGNGFTGSRSSAVLALAGATGTLRQNRIEDSATADFRSPAVAARDGATLQLAHNVIASNSLGVSASGAGTTVSLEGDEVRGHPWFGVEALAQALVSLDNVQLVENGRRPLSAGAGLLVVEGATAQVRSGSLRGNALGVLVEGAGSRADLENVLVTNSAGDGLLVLGAQATLQGATVQGNSGAGLRIGAGGQVTVTSTSIIGNASGVALAGSGSQMTLIASQVAGNAGPGIVLDSGAAAQLQQVTVGSNGQPGLVVRPGGAVLLVDSVVADNRQPVESAGTLVALNSTVDGQQPPLVQVPPQAPVVVLAPVTTAQVRDEQGQLIAQVQFFIFQHTPFGTGRAALLQGEINGLWIDGLSAEAIAELFPGQTAQLGSIGLVQAYPKVVSQTLRAPGVAVNLVLTDFPPGELALASGPALAAVAVPKRVRLTINGARLAAQAELRLVQLGPVRELGR
ncbi:MAG: right-handed parallel beta-helix repeat-containing protein, partial [Deinococcus sp.]|nr:right-handed parallel beta-helix repeat-containing protein [Deinococcus sp.]